jgi:restriction system protein
VKGTLELHDMSGQEFELFVQDQLLRKAFESVNTTPGSGDMGADLIIHHEGKKIVVQCKRSSNPVGLAAVQEVFGARRFYGAHEAWVVTNASFTEAARSLALATKVRLKIVKLKVPGH